MRGTAGYRFIDQIFADRRANAALRDLLIYVSRIEKRIGVIMATMDELRAAIARNHDAENSVIELLKGISQQLKDAQSNNDPAAIAAVIAEIDQSTDKLAAAVVENTPAT